MESIDAVRVNFNAGQLDLLNICLAFLMFGVALDIRISDFKQIFLQPKVALIGLFSQLILLPILTVFLAILFAPPASIALGMVLIAACPGGNVSNFTVHLAGANTALSVMLTSITTVGAVIITPLAFAFWSEWVPGTSTLLKTIQVNAGEMMLTIIQLVLIPLVLGMWLNHRYPQFAARLRRPVSILSIMIFFAFVIFATVGNYDNIINHVGKVFWIVLIHNALAILLGYLTATSFRLPRKDVQTISIETGIQNSGLGLILIFNFFGGLGGMAMIAAWWGIWHLISGFSIAMWFRRRNAAVLATVKKK